MERCPIGRILGLFLGGGVVSGLFSFCQQYINCIVKVGKLKV
jgi:hypothetical protein